MPFVKPFQNTTTITMNMNIADTEKYIGQHGRNYHVYQKLISKNNCKKGDINLNHAI